MEERDPNRLQEIEIQRLARMAEIDYENSMDQKLTMKMRESWHQRYTNTVLALNQPSQHHKEDTISLCWQ